MTQGSQVQSVRIQRVSLLSLPPQTVHSLAPSRTILKPSSRVDGFKLSPERMFNLSLGRWCLSSLQLFQEGVKFELGKFRRVVKELWYFSPYALICWFFFFFFWIAPVWSLDTRIIYLLKCDTTGIVLGKTKCSKLMTFYPNYLRSNCHCKCLVTDTYSQNPFWLYKNYFFSTFLYIFGQCCHVTKSPFSEKQMDSCRFIPK